MFKTIYSFVFCCLVISPHQVAKINYRNYYEFNLVHLIKFNGVNYYTSNKLHELRCIPWLSYI